MLKQVNVMLDKLSNYLAHRKGLLPFFGITLVFINLILQFVPGQGWLVEKNILLNLGVIIAIIGIMLGWTL